MHTIKQAGVYSNLLTLLQNICPDLIKKDRIEQNKVITEPLRLKSKMMNYLKFK